MTTSLSPRTRRATGIILRSSDLASSKCCRSTRDEAQLLAERLAAAFAVGDKVVVEGLKAKPKYNGKAAVVRGRVNARGRFPVTVEMRDGPETIALKLANLRAADE